MAALFITLLFAFGAIAAAVEPEYLDSLLESKNYEEFARIMGIENVDLVKPGPDNSDADPMFNKGLPFGDFLLSRNDTEQDRQGLRFDRYPSMRWPGQPARIPYTVSNQFSNENKDKINVVVNYWNRYVSCAKFVPRNGESDYVAMFPGNGCWSYLGRIRGEQALSLQQNGCTHYGIILHEMDHAAGFGHEQNRHDRDNYVDVLWENIPQEWRSQYEKQNPDHYGLQDRYDYSSIMHYGMKAPGTNKDAFRIKRQGVRDEDVGQRAGFTNWDIRKLEILYC